MMMNTVLRLLRAIAEYMVFFRYFDARVLKCSRGLDTRRFTPRTDRQGFRYASHSRRYSILTFRWSLLRSLNLQVKTAREAAQR